jgi:chemotaxis phosphatase CheX-like protein
MPEQDFGQLISESVDGVLETMFFSAPLGPAEPEPGDAVLEARLAFQGHPSGNLDVRISERSARLLAAGFLGEDEETLTDSQPGELANMLCGSLVSRLETEESFELASPELVIASAAAVAAPEDPPSACKSFELENGILTVTLRLEALV